MQGLGRPTASNGETGCKVWGDKHARFEENNRKTWGDQRESLNSPKPLILRPFLFYVDIADNTTDLL